MTASASCNVSMPCNRTKKNGYSIRRTRVHNYSSSSVSFRIISIPFSASAQSLQQNYIYKMIGLHDFVEFICIAHETLAVEHLCRAHISKFIFIVRFESIQNARFFIAQRLHTYIVFIYLY